MVKRWVRFSWKARTTFANPRAPLRRHHYVTAHTADAPRDSSAPRVPRVAVACPVVAQPAVARRADRLLRLIGVGVVASVASAACMVLASSTMLRLTSRAEIWALVGNMSAVLLALTSIMQFYLWWRARQEWRGVRDVAVGHWMLPSRLGHWVSYLLVVLIPLAAYQITRRASPEDASWWLALVGAVLGVCGVFFAARMEFDPAGPPGTVPARIRRNQRPGPSSPGADPHSSVR